MLFQCFKRHPNERITAHQMLAHEYLRHEQVPLDDDALQHTTAELERRASQAYESGDEDGASSTPVLSSGQATGHARNGSATLDLPEIAAEVEESEQKDAETIEKQREWLSELQEDVKREREKQQQNAPGCDLRGCCQIAGGGRARPNQVIYSLLFLLSFNLFMVSNEWPARAKSPVAN
jgi:serine/threonine protein kinase